MTIAAILIVLAALGGLTMLVMRLRGMERPPLLLAVGHGIIGLGGVVTLGYAYSQAELPSSANWALVVFILAALGGTTLFAGFTCAIVRSQYLSSLGTDCCNGTRPAAVCNLRMTRAPARR